MFKVRFDFRRGGFTSLAGIEPNYPNFVLKETLAPDAVAIERQLAEMELHHGGALLPIETFTEIILGARRVYVVLPEPSPFTGETLPVQPELSDVISWGVQLADALAFLHKNNISFGAAHLNHMSINGKAARWFNFTSARIQTPGTRTRNAYFDDVQALAAGLFVLLTGRVYSPDIPLEPPGLAGRVSRELCGRDHVGHPAGPMNHEARRVTRADRYPEGCLRASGQTIEWVGVTSRATS